MNTVDRPGRWVPWGKLRRSPDGLRVESQHALLDHMADVAACFLAVASCPNIARAMQRAAGPRHPALSAVQLARLAALVFMHDIGKANAGFQAKYWKSLRRGWPAPCGHGAEGWALFCGLAPPAVARELQGLAAPLDAWGPGVVGLLRASISHHGRPVGNQVAGLNEVWAPVRDDENPYDPAQAVAAIVGCVKRLYPLAFSDADEPLPVVPEFAHLFAGLVQLADWLGSDTREGFFPYSLEGEDRALTAPDRAVNAVRTIGLAPGATFQYLQAHPPAFQAAFDLPAPRPMQAALADLSLGPVVVLEAETGSGKTEAALWRFLHLYRAGEVDALYFALPTRVAATQLHERVAAFVRRVWPHEAPVVVRALPGQAAADGQTFLPLPDFQVLWSDRAMDQDAGRRWAAEAPKRYLVAPVAVGTIDQVLLGALQIKHAHLRQATLARSLLVVDEVHASDAYMTALLDHLLRAHVACGGQALLLSATLGSAARTRFLHVGTPTRRPSPPSLDEAQALPYPAISHRGADGVQWLSLAATQAAQKHVRWQTLDAIENPARIAALAVAAAGQGARVLVVRNTVPAAMATLRAVEGLVCGQPAEASLFRVRGVSTLHHSRFSRQDRPLMDAEVQRQLGKRRSGVEGRIVIGTQTLEQSLDLDADLLITDLCPMDVLLQRVGRLHRHQRPASERPPAFAEPLAWVLTPAAGNLASLLKRARHGLGPIWCDQELQGVYVDLRGLEATRRLIEAQPTRSIPADNRRLVEAATHGQALDAIAEELGPDWVEFGQRYEGAIGARAAVARLQALPFTEAFDALNFPEDEGRIGSRLGAADRLLHLDPPAPGPFGLAVADLALRHHQAPAGLAPDAEPQSVELLPEGGFEFLLGTQRYRYSRFGLERVRPPREEEAG